MNLKKFNFTNEKNFEKYTEEWLLFKKNSLKESTYCRYTYIIAKYLNPDLGKYNLKQLKKVNFNLFVSKFNNLSNSSISLILITLKSILKFIERKYDLDFKIDLIQLPQNTTKEITVFTDKEKECLYNYCINNYNFKNLGILLGLYAGLRIGEISALQWKDVDLKNNQIHINKTLQRINYKNNHTKIIVDSPKSKASRRIVLINRKLKNILSQTYKMYHPSKNAYVLTCNENNFIEPRGLEIYYNRILKKLKLPKYNFHVLRHTFATNCIQNQMNYKLLSKILGHANVNTTLNKYVHPSLDDAKIYLEKI